MEIGLKYVYFSVKYFEIHVYIFDNTHFPWVVEDFVYSLKMEIK